MFVDKKKFIVYAALFVSLLSLTTKIHAQQEGLWDIVVTTAVEGGVEPGLPVYIVRESDCSATVNIYVTTNISDPKQTFLGQESGQPSYPGSLTKWPSSAVIVWNPPQPTVLGQPYYFSAQIVSGTCTVDSNTTPPVPSTTPYYIEVTDE
jgi:hypothetical protein